MKKFYFFLLSRFVFSVYAVDEMPHELQHEGVAPVSVLTYVRRDEHTLYCLDGGQLVTFPEAEILAEAVHEDGCIEMYFEGFSIMVRGQIQ